MVLPEQEICILTVLLISRMGTAIRQQLGYMIASLLNWNSIAEMTELNLSISELYVLG